MVGVPTDRTRDVEGEFIIEAKERRNLFRDHFGGVIMTHIHEAEDAFFGRVVLVEFIRSNREGF